MASTDPRIAFFNRAASSWDADGPPHAQILARLAAMQETLGLAPGQDVLELGCGTGQTTAWLAEQVAPGRVTALDFSPEMLARARERGGAVEYLCTDACIGELGAARFDVVFAMHVWPHLRDRPAALRNLRQALRPGGRLIVLHCDSWQNVNLFHASLPEPVSHDLLPPPEVMHRELAGGGFEVVTWREAEDLFLVIATMRGAE